VFNKCKDFLYDGLGGHKTGFEHKPYQYGQPYEIPCHAVAGSGALLANRKAVLAWGFKQ
jgi:hypothetical protein